MQLNRAGEAITHWWLELRRKFTTVETDEFIVMPNHCHGIVIVADSTVGADLRVGLPNDRTGAHPARQGAHTSAPLPEIIQWFKTMTTNEYLRGMKTLGWPSFHRRLRQRSFYDHIIRNEDSLNRIRQYIIENPARWEFDRENPEARSVERDAAY